MLTRENADKPLGAVGALQVARVKNSIDIFADEPWYLLDLHDEVSQRTNKVDTGISLIVDAASRLVAQRTGELVIVKYQNGLLTLEEIAVQKLVTDGKENNKIACIFEYL